MNFAEIKKLIGYINYIKETINVFPSGKDIKVPSHIIDKVEKVCDILKIPVYRISSDTLSIASTYLALKNHEMKR